SARNSSVYCLLLPINTSVIAINYGVRVSTKGWPVHLAARRDVEQLSSSFRPVPEPHALTRMQDVERKAFEATQRYWDAEQSGEHP
ncbi:hypothetical protein, partial [Stenotrophomonas acidaminiphila]|uniref:hypothetical protein n=1 Tax=Stenotrophomonas acidaminiphila TaxID=128780 RepID=UPI003617CD9A